VTRFLLNANLGFRTAAFLRERFGFDVDNVVARGLGHLPDDEIAVLAVREDRAIITFDLDFGELFHRGEYPALGVILLRIGNQSTDGVNAALGAFFAHQEPGISLTRTLVIIDDSRVRIVRAP